MTERLRELGAGLAIMAAGLLVFFLFAPRQAHAAPVKPTQNEPKISVEIVFMSPQAAFDYCKADGAWPGLAVRPLNQALGCTTFYREEKRCVIVTPEPVENGDDAMLNLGHEVLHCVFGGYHG